MRPISRLNPAEAVKTRTHSLVEIMGLDAAGQMAPVMALLNNRRFHDNTEYRNEPVTADTLEVWEFVNTTVDSHPIHLHLVQFQVLNRQPIDTVAYLAASGYDLNGDGMLTEDEVGRGTYPPPAPTAAQLIGPARPPAANEMGWKDTVAVPPGMVTRIVVPFGSGAVSTRIAARSVYVPDYGATPPENDYVWHCHILEHEEKDMMQHYRIEEQPTGP